MNSSPPPPDPNEPKLNQLKDRGFKSTFEQSPTKNHVERRNKAQQEHRAQLLNQRRGVHAQGLANGTNHNDWMHPGASPPSQSLRPDISLNGFTASRRVNTAASANGIPPSSMADADGDNAMGDESSSSGSVPSLGQSHNNSGMSDQQPGNSIETFGPSQGSGFSFGQSHDGNGMNDEQSSSNSAMFGQQQPAQGIGSQNQQGEDGADGLDALLESFSKLSVEKPKVEKCIICLKDIRMDKNYVPHVYECLDRQDNEMRLERIRIYQRENIIQQHCRFGMRCHHRDEAHFMDFLHPDGHPGPKSFSLSKQEMDPQFLEPVRMVNCPVCQYRLADFQMNEHLDTCTKEQKLLSQKDASSSSAAAQMSPTSSMSDVSNVHSNAMPRPSNQRPPSQTPAFGVSTNNASGASDFSYPKDPLDEEDKSDDEDEGALNLPQVVAFSEHAMSVKNQQGEREYQEVLRKMEQMGLNQKSLKATMNKHQKKTSKQQQQQQAPNGFPPQKPHVPPSGDGGLGSFSL